MKTIALALFLTASFGQAALAQDKEKTEIRSSDVPDAVMTSFNNNFKGTTDVEWKKKGNDYKVSFRMNNAEHHAMYNSSGTLLSQGQKISESELPAAVQNALKKDYPNHKVDEIYTLVKDGTTRYKIELDGSPDWKVVYSANGMEEDRLEDD